jgi:hypothetical protein
MSIRKFVVVACLLHFRDASWFEILSCRWRVYYYGTLSYTVLTLSCWWRNGKKESGSFTCFPPSNFPFFRSRTCKNNQTTIDITIRRHKIYRDVIFFKLCASGLAIVEWLVPNSTDCNGNRAGSEFILVVEKGEIKYCSCTVKAANQFLFSLSGLPAELTNTDQTSLAR